MKKTVKKNTDSLVDKISTTQWKIFEPGRGTTRVGCEDISVCFAITKPANETADEVRIRFGIEVIKKLDWKVGDKICIYHDNDDLMSFMLVKSDSGVGYTLQKESAAAIFRLHFKWNRPLIIQKMPPTNVSYDIFKKHIVFRASN